MSDKVTQNPNYIFFLQLNGELPEAFYQLSAGLSILNISLVPVSLTDYMSFSKQDRVHTILLVTDLKKLAAYKSLRELYLDFSLKNGRTVLYEISSFGPIDIAHQLRYQDIYTHIQLPEKIDQVCRNIARKYYKQKKSISIWPGGRRAKLPVML